MATYAIGDVQGCFVELQQLLKKIHYQPNKDFLWFCGDLVNRGPNSLEVLRFAKSLVEQQRATIVLGNHDLHLLCVFHQIHPLKSTDTFQDILYAPDAEELCQWLRQQPILHYDSALNFVLVHAGIPPQWPLDEAQIHAKELEQQLRSEQFISLLQPMYGNEPALWQPQLSSTERLRYIINGFTRMRWCSAEGALEFNHKGTLAQSPKGFLPWFRLRHHHQETLNIVFGHWSALHEHWQQITESNIFPIDSGCVWGHSLTALRLEDGIRFMTKKSG